MGQQKSKFDYGIHETEVFQRNAVPEVELTQVTNCPKDHDNYILPQEMTLEDLPEMYREVEVYDFVKYLAGLTVRIAVLYSSPHRKKHWQGTEAEYPGYSRRGQSILMTGSGRISDVFRNKDEDIKCPCDDCKSPSAPEREVWNILVFTATHVVYDSIEAERSNYKLFYDTDNGERKVFYGVKKVWSNVAGDLCLLSCATCDKELADTLQDSIQTFNALWKNLRDRYKCDKIRDPSERKYRERLVIVVSHPHGCQKQISLGYFLGKEKKKIESSPGVHINYNASTCPGSSGSPVYLFGQEYFKTEYVHSGSGSDRKINYSTTWCPEKTKKRKVTLLK